MYNWLKNFFGKNKTYDKVEQSYIIGLDPSSTFNEDHTLLRVLKMTDDLDDISFEQESSEQFDDDYSEF